MTEQVTIQATYQHARWVDICEECGATVPDCGRDASGRIPCPQCDHLGEPDICDTPEIRRGWCDPERPFDTIAWTDHEPIVVAMDVADAIAMLAEFPGAIWGYREDGTGGETNYRTGAVTTVTAHVSGGDIALAAVAKWLD